MLGEQHLIPVLSVRKTLLLLHRNVEEYEAYGALCTLQIDRLLEFADV